MKSSKLKKRKTFRKIVEWMEADIKIAEKEGRDSISFAMAEDWVVELKKLFRGKKKK